MHVCCFACQSGALLSCFEAAQCSHVLAVMQVVSCPLQWCLRGTGQKSKESFHNHLQWVVGVEGGVVATAMVAGA